MNSAKNNVKIWGIGLVVVVVVMVVVSYW